MKAFRIIGRSFRDAFKSVFRNFSLSMASILCATITLMVVSVSFLIAANVNDATKSLESELSIVVYLEQDASESDANFLQSTIKKLNNVEKVEYKSKDEWKQEMSQYNESFGTIFEKYETNPLLDSFTVTVKDANSLNTVAEKIRDMDKVESANYGEDAVSTILSVFDVVSIFNMTI